MLRLGNRQDQAPNLLLDAPLCISDHNVLRGSVPPQATRAEKSTTGTLRFSKRATENEEDG